MTDVELTHAEKEWIDQEVCRSMRTLELLLGRLLESEYERLKLHVLKRCLKTLRKEGESHVKGDRFTGSLRSLEYISANEAGDRDD
jgi:hypothetical protein